MMISLFIGHCRSKLLFHCHPSPAGTTGEKGWDTDLGMLRDTQPQVDTVSRPSISPPNPDIDPYTSTYRGRPTKTDLAQTNTHTQSQTCRLRTHTYTPTNRAALTSII